MRDISSYKVSEQKLFVQRLGLVGAINILAGFSGIILLPVLTKNLSIEDYGIWVQVNVTLGLASVIVLMGLTEALTRFTASARDAVDVRERFYSIFLMVMAVGIVFSITIFLFSKPLAAALFGGNILAIRLLSVMQLIEALNTIIFFYFRTVQQMKRYSFFIFINTYLSVVLVSALVMMGWGILGALIGFLASKAAILIITMSLIVSEMGFKFPMFKDSRAYLAFGLPIVPSSLSSWIINSSDRYVIGLLIGPAAVGIYSPGYILGNIVMMLMGPISIVLPVALCRYYDDGRIDIIGGLISRSLKYYLALAIPATFGLTLISRPALSILSTSQIADQGYLITPLVALSMLVFGVISIVSNIISLKKRTTILCMIWVVAAILNLALTFILVSHIGIIGAAIATLAAFIFILLVVGFISIRYLAFEVDYRFIFKSIIASLVMSLLIVMHSPSNSLELLAMIIISAGIYVVMLVLLKGVNKEEIELIKEMLA